MDGLSSLTGKGQLHIKSEVGAAGAAAPPARGRKCAAGALVHGAGGSVADGEGQHRQA